MSAQSINKPPAVWRVFMKIQNPFMKWLLRSPFHVFVSRMYLLLTFTGRKSGKIYSTPVQYARQGSTLYVITSEGYTWWKNLRGGAAVQVHLRGKVYDGHADTATDPQSIQAFARRFYPNLSEARIAQFVPGKVAITIALRDFESQQGQPARQARDAEEEGVR